MQREDAKMKTTAIFVLLVTRKWLTANYTNTTNLLLDQLAQRPPGAESKGIILRNEKHLLVQIPMVHPAGQIAAVASKNPAIVTIFIFGLGRNGTPAGAALKSPPNICCTAHHRVTYHYLRSFGAPDLMHRPERRLQSHRKMWIGRSLKQSRRTLDALYHLI